MKKILTLTCLLLAIASVSACAGTDGSVEPSEEPAKTTEEVTEPTEEPVAEPTEESTTEATTEEASEDELIVLWNTMTVDACETTISQVLSETSPADSFNKGFLDFIGRYWFWDNLDQTDEGRLFHFQTPWNLETIVLSNPSDENSDQNVDIYYLETSENSVITVFDADGTKATTQFLPLYYNPGKKCLVGYWVDSGATSLVECYWASDSFSMIEVEDSGVYGL